MEDLALPAVSTPPNDNDRSRQFNYANNDNLLRQTDIDKFRARFNNMAHDRISHDVGIMVDEFYLLTDSSATFDETSVCPSALVAYPDNRQIEASGNTVISGTETETKVAANETITHASQHVQPQTKPKLIRVPFLRQEVLQRSGSEISLSHSSQGGSTSHGIRNDKM
jgi:hypothetical protein